MTTEITTTRTPRPRRRPRPSPRPAVLLGATTGVVVVLLLVAAAVRPAAVSPTGGSTTLPVTDTTLVCGSVPSATGSTAVVAAGAAGPATSVADTISIRRLGQPVSAKPLATTVGGATLLRVGVPPAVAGPLVVHATGSLARGLSAMVWVLGTSGAATGLAAQPCTAPSNDSWFVGGGAGIGRTSALVLSNPSTAPSIVDLTVYGAKGASKPSVGQGITVAGGKQVAVVLDTLVPGEPATAVEVRSRSGRVAAVLTDNQVSGLNPGGNDAVAPAAPPATSVVVPGVAGDLDGRRALSLVVPGPDNAVVRVRVSTAQGLLSPADLAAIEVPAGQLVSVDLARLGAIGAYSLVIDSDQPLVAGVRTLRSAPRATPDFAYAVGSLPLTAAVVLPFAKNSRSLATTVLLTATGDTDRTVTLTTRPDVGAPSTQTVTVTAGTTVAVSVGGRAVLPFAVTITPQGTGATLYGAWVASGLKGTGRLVAGLPLTGTPATQTLPGVQQDPAVGLPGH